MRYTFCDFLEQICLGGDGSPVLVPGFGGRKLAGSAPFGYTTGSSCYWRITAPTEWTEYAKL